MVHTNPIVVSLLGLFENKTLSSQNNSHCKSMERAEIIKNIKQVAQNSLPSNATVLLYGSQARGDAHKGSDWDLLIILDKQTLTTGDYNLAYPFRELGWNINEEISPQVYSRKEWNNFSYTPFYKNVEQDKIVLQ